MKVAKKVSEIAKIISIPKSVHLYDSCLPDSNLMNITFRCVTSYCILIEVSGKQTNFFFTIVRPER